MQKIEGSVGLDSLSDHIGIHIEFPLYGLDEGNHIFLVYVGHEIYVHC